MFPFSCNIVHLLILLNPFMTNAITVINPEDLPQTSSFGALYEIENGQLLYEATAPIIYTVRLPNWLHFLVLPEKAQNCSAKTFTTQSSFCEIFTAFHEITEAIRSSTQTVPSTFPSVTEESTWGLSCNYISKHFSSSFITPAIVQKYMGFLRSCSDGVIIEEPLIDNYIKLPDAKLFQQYDQLWTSTFFSKFEESPSSADNLNLLLEAVKTGEVESILSLGLSNFLTETIRWNGALLKCGIGQIPDSIISPERFYKSLHKLNITASAHNSGFRLVIPPKETFLPVYFKSEFLTDCTISKSTFIGENGNSHEYLDLIVRILVPITKKDTDWKHVSVKTFPFVMNNSNILVYPEFPPALQAENYKFIFDNSSKILFTSDTKLCDTTKPGFCRVPQLWDSRRVVRSNCPMELLSGQLYLNRTSKCTRKVQVSALEFPGMPFIVKDGSHTVYLTGVRDESVNYDISITCQKDDLKSSDSYYYTFPEEGALKIVLACGCHLQVRKLNNAIIKPELGLGCSSTLDVSVVLPI